MAYLFLGYPKCSTSGKAQKWLDDNNIEYEFRDIVKNNPTKTELKEWIKNSQLPIRKFFNTSGLLYKSMGLKDKLDSMSDAEQIELLSGNGMLVKRPLLLGKNTVIVGFKPQEWEEQLKK